LLREIDAWYQVFLQQGSGPVLDAWVRLCDMDGKAVRVDCNELEIEGIMTGLADDGALLVRTATGKMERVYAGDVRPV
jgi:BirA family biotin operon repressor/biotin-[acetyl-CoA-carboxylase] ligase